MKLFVALLGLFVFSVAWSQKFTVSGYVFSKKGEPLPFAQVTAYSASDTTQLIAYSISDDKGFYQLEMEKGTYLFKVSFMGYKTINKIIAVDHPIKLNWTLQEDVNVLKEVVIRTQVPVGKQKGDTLEYNMKAVLSGTELTAKEIVDKLPGLEMDESGRLSFQGKIINHLLINGKPLQSNQYRMILESLSAEMIEGVSVIENYKDAYQPGENTQPETALNFKTKKKFSGKWKGNMLGAGGWNNKYSAEINLHQFNDKSNFMFIGGVNNTGDQTITLKDYLSISGFLKHIDGKQINRLENPPVALLPNVDVASKSEKIMAGNWTFEPSKRMRLGLFFLGGLNQTLIRQQGVRYFTHLPELPLQSDTRQQNKFRFWHQKASVSFKINENFYANYQIKYLFNKNTDTIKKLLGAQSFNNTSVSQSQELFQSLGLAYKIQKHRFNFLLFGGYHQPVDHLSILSGQNFLGFSFPQNECHLYQSQNTDIKTYGWKAEWSYRFHDRWTGNLKFVQQNNVSSYSNKIFPFEIIDFKQRNLTFFDVFPSLQYKNPHVNIVSGIHFLNYRDVKKTKKIFFPELFADIKINQHHRISFSYHLTSNPIPLKYLGDTLQVEDETTRVLSEIKNLSIEKKQNAGFTYFWVDLYYGWMFWTGIQWEKVLDGWSNRIAPHVGYQEKIIARGKPSEQKIFFAHGEKRWSFWPVSTTFQGVIHSAKSFQLLNDAWQTIHFNTQEWRMKLFTRFQGKWNFEWSWNGKFIKVNRNNPTFITTKISHNFLGKVIFHNKRLRLETSFGFERIFHDKESLRFHHIHATLLFTLGKNVQAYVKARDLLYLNQTERLKLVWNDLYTEELHTSVLSGYVLLGLNVIF